MTWGRGSSGRVGLKGSLVLGRSRTGSRLPSLVGTTSSCIALLCASIAKSTARTWECLRTSTGRRGLLLVTSLWWLSS
ncbi:unnamed protein product [Linum tenue]|uniref:Uncharacterized protein n=1 Tax=Linum tenue TaxID=586396 RepID=A0AAV0KQP5_9ROSI|nr:unnamed protein product [Linum tenue]